MKRVYPPKGENQFWQIAENETWVPGAYATKEAANLAFGLDDKQLATLQDRKNREAGGEGGIITVADLRDHFNSIPS